MIKNYFLIDKKRYGKNLIMFCRTIKGVFCYDHDKIYDKHIDHLDSLDCWHKYGRYTKTYGIPYPMNLDCENILEY